MSSSYLLTAAILIACLSQSFSAPPSINTNQRSTRSFDISKRTCLHQDEASKKSWKSCPKASKTGLPSYKNPDLDLPGKLSHSAIPAMEIPPK